MVVLSATGIYIAWVAPEDGCVDNYAITVSSDDSEFTYAVDHGTDFLEVTNATAGTTYNVSVVSNVGSESSAPATGRNTTCELFVVMLVFFILDGVGGMLERSRIGGISLDIVTIVLNPLISPTA